MKMNVGLALRLRHWRCPRLQERQKVRWKMAARVSWTEMCSSVTGTWRAGCTAHAIRGCLTVHLPWKKAQYTVCLRIESNARSWTWPSGTKGRTDRQSSEEADDSRALLMDFLGLSQACSSLALGHLVGLQKSLALRGLRRRSWRAKQEFS